jgi:hypothetical protein
MNVNRVVSIGICQWAIERTRDGMTSDLLPTIYADASEAACVVFEMARTEWRRQQASRFGKT